MGSVARFLAHAVAEHRQAASLLLDAEAAMQTMAAEAASGVDAEGEHRRLVRQLDDLVRSWLPDWLGRPLDDTVIDLPVRRDAVPGRSMYLRPGDAYPSQDGVFPAVAPFVDGGHPTIDTDARDPVVAAWLRGVLLRTLAALPDGTLRVLPVDGATPGVLFAPFRPLMDAEAWALPATALTGMWAVLDEAERQILAVQSGDLPDPPVWVIAVAVAALPSGAGRSDWARLSAVAHAGPAAWAYLLLIVRRKFGSKVYAIPSMSVLRAPARVAAVGVGPQRRPERPAALDRRNARWLAANARQDSGSLGAGCLLTSMICVPRCLCGSCSTGLVNGASPSPGR